MNADFQDIKFATVGIGSLPYRDIESAIDAVKKYYYSIPFLPQLINLSENEGILSQYTEGMSSFFAEYNETTASEILADFEQIVQKNNFSDKLLEKYSINFEHSHALPKFIEFIKSDKNIHFSKTQVVGAYTFLKNIKNSENEYLLNDKRYRNIIPRYFALKALWQIQKIKSARPNITPIVFIDEPSLTLHTDINREEIISMIQTMCSTVKSAGALCGIHCCGNFDINIMIDGGTDILSINTYSYLDNLTNNTSKLSKFLNNNGKIVWGLVPVSESLINENTTADTLAKLFEEGVTRLTYKGINEKLIIENALISTTCGAGKLEYTSTKKVLSLLSEISSKLKERYNDV